ncbi:MAG: hypothetical protein IT379_18460, partial [Deltaproteobacteria bacterium]|nr:hypothetical protein [Deltaproteobacteria bacterium]
MTRVGWAIALSSVAVGCSDDPEARIDVVVSEQPPGLSVRLERIELHVSRLHGEARDEVRTEETDAEHDGAALRPWTVAVTPARAGDVGSVLYRFRALGVSGGRAIVAKQASTTFVAGQRFVLPLRFDAECVDLACPPELTCLRGVCVSDVVECSAARTEIVCREPMTPPPDASAPQPAPPLDASMDSGVAPPPPPPIDLGQEAAIDAGPEEDMRVPCPSEVERSLDSNQCGLDSA